MSPAYSDMNHDAQDSIADWANTHKTVIGCATFGCVGDCKQGREACKHPAPAEAATEIGAEPKERMGVVQPWERIVMDKEFQKFLAIYFGAIVAALLLFWLSFMVTK